MDNDQRNDDKEFVGVSWSDEAIVGKFYLTEMD